MNEELDLNKIREKITKLDQQLLELFAERRSLTLNVAKSKAHQVRPVRDQQREQELLIRLIKQGKEHGLADGHQDGLEAGKLEGVASGQEFIQQQVQNPLASELLRGEYPEGTTVRIDFADGEFVIGKV